MLEKVSYTYKNTVIRQFVQPTSFMTYCASSSSKGMDIKMKKHDGVVKKYTADKENLTVANDISQIGFWSAACSAFFYLAFDISAILNMSGVLTSRYWISVLYYTPSIFLALSFVIMIVSIHYYASTESKIYTHIGITLACIYATINCFIYIIQVLIIAPSMLNGQFDSVALFEMAPGKPLIAANALAYTLMGLSTLFSAFAFKGGTLKKTIRTLLLTHGIISPAIVAVLIWQPFFYISAFVGIIYPLAAILIAVLFRPISQFKKKCP